MGACTSLCRIALLHQNIPNMIGQITSILAAGNVNIANMLNKSRDQYAYTMADLETPVDAQTMQKLASVEGVMRVRMIK